MNRYVAGSTTLLKRAPRSLASVRRPRLGISRSAKIVRSIVGGR